MKIERVGGEGAGRLLMGVGVIGGGGCVCE